MFIVQEPEVRSQESGVRRKNPGAANDEVGNSKLHRLLLGVPIPLFIGWFLQFVSF
jgi:hypothetical protein